MKTPMMGAGAIFYIAGQSRLALKTAKAIAQKGFTVLSPGALKKFPIGPCWHLRISLNSMKPTLLSLVIISGMAHATPPVLSLAQAALQKVDPDIRPDHYDLARKSLHQF